MNDRGMLIPKKYRFLLTRYKRLFVYLILILAFAKFAPVVANNPRFCASCHERNKQIPILSLKPPEDKVCLKCHTLHRTVTPTGDLIIPHERHEPKKVKCIICHSRVVHGESGSAGHVAASVSTSFGEYEYFNKDTDPIKTNTPPMGLCMSCHKRREITLECGACHTNTKQPESHQQRLCHRHQQEPGAYI